MFSNIKAIENLYFTKKAGRTLQATLEEAKIENLFKTPKDKEADTEIVMDDLVMGIETLLDMMTIAL
jgi:hypothetical protein